MRSGRKGLLTQLLFMTTKQTITIEIENPPTIGIGIVALNIASAIRKACPGAKFTFTEGGKDVPGIHMMIPKNPFFRNEEAFSFSVPQP